MRKYIIQRIFYMMMVVFVVSVVAFVVIQLPPGDYLDSYLRTLAMEGGVVNIETIARLRSFYGLDEPVHLRYFVWMRNIILRGDFGHAFAFGMLPVTEVLFERLPWTIAISLITMVFTFAMAVPIGVYSAVKQYSIGDYIFSIIGFIGMAVPSFLMALFLMYTFHVHFGLSIGGLFSPEFVGEPWSMPKIVDLLRHIWVPVIVIGIGGTAGLIRVLRACLLDELQKQYVITARSKGLTEPKLLFKYPVRVALNPVFSTLGWALPGIVSGETIVAIVLNLPTNGPLILQALMQQDMYLAGASMLFLTILTVIGTMLSDILLVWADPRIRYEKTA